MLQNILSLNISHLCCVDMPEVSVHIIVDTVRASWCLFISEHLNLHLAIEKSERQSDRCFVSLKDYRLHESQCECQEGSMTEPSLPLTFWEVQQVCQS